VDWLLYLLSILLLLDIGVYEVGGGESPSTYLETKGCSGRTCWQWPLGSIIITTAWLNFLCQLRFIGFFGIFILMLENVIKTVARFSIVVAIFVLAFGFGFHLLFINQLAFDSTSEALLKTFVMMIGEYEFEGIFTEHHDRRGTRRRTRGRRATTLSPSTPASSSSSLSS